MNESLGEVIREAEQNYVHGNTQISEYVTWDMHDTIETIDAYLNSKHITGPQDSLGRDKPFFNIVTAATNIWYRATDLDRKNIRILPDSAENTGMAFIATVLLQNWMKEARFGVFLNAWGRSLARYGSSVCKFVVKDGKLSATIVPWNRLIVDPIDFEALPVIEKIYMTPAQLQQKTEYDQERVKGLLENRETRETLDGDKKDNQGKFVEIYEVHGEMSLETYKISKGEEPNEGDELDFFQQMHVISFTGNEKDGFEDYTLFSGRETKSPYLLTHLIEEDGRTLAIGAVEYLFDPQWMVNHTQKNVKDTLDLASKLIFQTSDGTYTGRNVLNAIETGDIMIHKPNEPMTRLANDKPDISAFMKFGEQWQAVAQEITSTPEALRGTTLPSGTPYALGAFLGGQANSLFEIMTENKGLDVEDMMRIHILPHLTTKMNNKDEVVAILEADSISEIDAMYVPRQAIKRHNEAVKKSLQNFDETGKLPEEFDQVAGEQVVQNELGTLGNKRPFKPDELDEKTWKEALKDFSMKVVVEVTNENTDKQAVLTTLSSLLQSIATNPAILQDPNARMLFNNILIETGRISPIQMTTAQAQTPTQLTGGADALSELTK